MSLNQFRDQRERLSIEAEADLEKDVKEFRSRLFDSILEIVVGFSLSDEGTFRVIPSNIRKGLRVNAIVETETARFNRSFVRKIVRKVTELLGYNRRYFREQANYNVRIDEQVRKVVLLRLGYDSDSRTLVPNGWLDVVTKSASTSIGQTIAENITSALSGGVTLSDFRRQFRAAFTGPGVGYPEYQYLTFTRDLFQAVDRETNKIYADELGIDYFLYSGTIKDNTRPFCKARAGNYYSREEVKSWKDLDFQGKIKVGYNPFTHCGGYNCRHHLSAITRETLEALGKLDEVDTYN
jgi:hypothetical protein